MISNKEPSKARSLLNIIKKPRVDQLLQCLNDFNEGLSCIFPRVHYSDALQLTGLESIRAHQENLTEDLFKSIVKDPRSKITSLLPSLVSASYELRRQRRFAMPPVKKNRIGNSFIVKSSRKASK